MNAHSLRLRALSGMRCTVARELVHVMLSDTWQQATVPLTMPSLAAPPRIHTAFQSTVNNAAGRPATSRAVALTSVVLPLGILLGTRLGGINNAATSWIIVYPLVFLVSTIDTCRVTERSQLGNLHLTFIPCVAGLCMFASTFLSRNLAAAHLPVAVRGNRSSHCDLRGPGAAARHSYPPRCPRTVARSAAPGQDCDRGDCHVSRPWLPA